MPRLLAPLLLVLTLLFAPAVHADPLDTVLDVLYKSGAIDGNVKAAKPLIACLAKGKSVQDCTLGAAGESELANDPQVQNVISVYQSYQQQDWFGLVKKTGVAVGCTLIPGGEVKDALCGEIGKVAIAVINGVGSVLHSLGNAVASLFGGGDKTEAPPMWDEDYYRLFFAPAYHKLIMALDSQDGSFEPIVQGIYGNCSAYYGQFQQYATNACEADAPRLRDQAKFLHKTLLQEGDSWFQLHSVPKLEPWTREHYGENPANFVAAQVAQCRADVKTAIPLPNPGFDRCAAFQAQAQQVAGSLIATIIGQQDAQCQAQAKALQVLPPHDAYAMACETVEQKLPALLQNRMQIWKQRMDLAQAAGCSNQGTPDSIHCDTYASQLACLKALPDKSSLCGFDVAKADQNFAQEIFAQLYNDSANAGKPQRCLRTVAQVLCFRPVKQTGCKIYVMLHGDKYGLGGQGDAICKLQSDAQYDQLKAEAQQVLAALNDNRTPLADAAARRRVITLPQSQSTRIMQSTTLFAVPAAACALSDDDPLKIECASGFQWDAQPARAAAITAILGAPFGFCAADYETDGADVPCLAGSATGAFPKGPGNLPPPKPPVRLRLPLSPAVDQQHPPKKTPPLRIQPPAPVKSVYAAAKQPGAMA